MNLHFLPALLLVMFVLPFTGSGRHIDSVQSKATSGGVGYARVPVRRTGIRFPRLTRFRNREVMRRVNRQIDEVTPLAFNFSRRGLKVQPAWPHVIEACAELVTVPYDDLKRFAAPEGVLARVIR